MYNCYLCGKKMDSVVKNGFYCTNEKCDELNVTYGIPEIQKRNALVLERMIKVDEEAYQRGFIDGSNCHVEG